MLAFKLCAGKKSGWGFNSWAWRTNLPWVPKTVKCGLRQRTLFHWTNAQSISDERSQQCFWMLLICVSRKNLNLHLQMRQQTVLTDHSFPKCSRALVVLTLLESCAPRRTACHKHSELIFDVACTDFSKFSESLVILWDGGGEISKFLAMAHWIFSFLNCWTYLPVLFLTKWWTSLCP